ncbi:MAG: hypothetical protein Kow00114_36580 [Kiloniellaceae bacterium]
MRQGSNNGRRPRGRTNRKQHGGGGGQSRTHTFDSNGPDGRVRGNARQVYEKYVSLARDATSAGDRIAAEAYFQHAEHYFRILSDSTDPTPSGRRHEDRPQPPYGQDEGYYGDDDDDAPVNGAQGGQGYAQGNGQSEGRHESRHEGRHEGRQDNRQEGRQDTRHEGRQDGRQHGGQRPPRRDGEPRAAAPAGEPQPDLQAQPQPDVPAIDGEAPARPRRGRPRKPRPDDDGQPRQSEAAPETESGPAAS